MAIDVAVHVCHFHLALTKYLASFRSYTEDEKGCLVIFMHSRFFVQGGAAFSGKAVFWIDAARRSLVAAVVIAVGFLLKVSGELRVIAGCVACVWMPGT
ncbi:hypothetical protein [Dyella sp. Tek66A03]|uniref:hypothetical protein n=1 Tax=Dyella sp. Tek66A03 TaxID=3458298 RepID=UPI00403E3E27